MGKWFTLLSNKIAENQLQISVKKILNGTICNFHLFGDERRLLP